MRLALLGIGICLCLASAPIAQRAEPWTRHTIDASSLGADGLPDVLLSDRFGAMAGLRWLENPGPASAALNGPWTNHWIGLRDRAPMLIDAADLDGDGVDEIVVPHYLKDDFRLSTLKRSGSGSTAWVEHAIRYPAIAGRPKAVAIGDIDLDGRPDLVLSCEQASNGKRGIVWLRFRSSPLQADWDVFDLSAPTV